MTALYLNLCYNEVCYKGNALYVLCTLTVKRYVGNSLKCPQCFIQLSLGKRAFYGLLKFS